MQTRYVLLTLTIMLSIMLSAGKSPASLEANNPGREAVRSVEMLGAILKTPVEWRLGEGPDGCDQLSADLDVLRALLATEECPVTMNGEVVNAVIIAAMQGLYEQIQERDKILVELNEQNQKLQRQLNALESQRREDQAQRSRLEARLNDTLNNLERQVGSTTAGSSGQQDGRLSQRLSSIETERRGEQSRLNRLESRLDAALSRMDRQATDLQSRLSRMESRVNSISRY